MNVRNAKSIIQSTQFLSISDIAKVFFIYFRNDLNRSNDHCYYRDNNHWHDDR